MKKISILTFADSICDARSRKIKSRDVMHFVSTQINNIINWSSVNKIIEKHYPKGKHKAGNRSYDCKKCIRKLEFNH